MAEDHSAERIEILPVTGMGELRPGDDLAGLIIKQASLQSRDVLVVTSKAVSKVEGRLIALKSDDPEERTRMREEAITAEATRIIAQRGSLRIVQTRHGLVLAAGGVDESNVARDELALLPEDPDRSASQLREAIRERTGVDVAVIISDSLGRPWRSGITDAAIGVAGLSAVFDARGKVDMYGNTLDVTVVAVADEIAAAADLVKGKLNGVPVAIVRGLHVPDDGRGSSPLIRAADEDMFRLGTAEAIALGREDAGGATEIAPPLHADAVSVVTAFAPDSPARQGFLAFLAARPDAMWRSCLPGHVTASALLLDPSRQTVLLTLHPLIGKWLPLGGHCEPGDHTLLDAAAREAREESGIGALSMDPLALDIGIHHEPCSAVTSSRHFDVCFLAVAPHGAQIRRSDESLDLRWFGWDELPDAVHPDVRGLIAAARLRLAG